MKSILDISKLEAGVITPSLRPVALDEIFASLAVDIEPLARVKKLSLTWRPNVWAVISDPLMLRRILQNLFANAVQYTQKGDVKLVARRRGEDVRIEVWDTGPGVPPAERQMIFEEFQRGRAIDRPAIDGFGLGLSIVQRMAETLGHPWICARASATARGSRLALRLRHGRGSRGAERAGNPRVLVRIRRSQSAVIDNDTYVLEAMQALLERWSCEARRAQRCPTLKPLSERLPARYLACRFSSRSRRMRSHRGRQTRLAAG